MPLLIHSWPDHRLGFDQLLSVQTCRYGRLDILIRSGMIRFNSALVWLVSRLHLAPKGLEEVHTMLVKVATSLTDGGRTGVFSPMHLLVRTP